ncbi:hypothetical protein BB560_005471, partial [Smittium megazygosporum]
APSSSSKNWKNLATKKRKYLYFELTYSLFLFSLSLLGNLALATIKDTLQALVDDGKAHLEKVGTSNYYWAFPSEAVVKRKRKLEELQSQHSDLTKQKNTLEAQINESLKGKEESDERKELEAQLFELEETNKKQSESLERFRECDPEVLRALKEKSTIAKTAANRWTDNIFILQSWCRDKFNIETSTFNKQFGLPDDFDNIP